MDVWQAHRSMTVRCPQTFENIENLKLFRTVSTMENATQRECKYFSSGFSTIAINLLIFMSFCFFQNLHKKRCVVAVEAQMVKALG